MHDNRTHPLLQQLPLTVSPFVNLPTATTLPYRYKPMPSTLPPSTTGITATSTTNPSDTDPSTPNNPTPNNTNPPKPRYVVSPSGFAAHPDEILASCRALHAHVTELLASAEADLARFDERVRARELAEKRRVAPGWLDSEARLLEPERAAGAAGATGGVMGGSGSGSGGVVGAGMMGMSEVGDGQLGGGGGGIGGGQGEMLLQQPVRRYGEGYGSGYGDGHGHGRGGASEMAVPDEGEELDRAFGMLQMGK
ncbi:hypothetical protein F5144DRAFT_527566 [Chaetomium tenue]|uniref:Uncharacterized protein n=1 Tax=Chaetomium tenue TaxID=1854479 RepID=A0ACB7PLL0_9PEZI|nr:hypothetical protein F5144DRAFT_527566 [Chaetomium globosum]